MPPCQTALWMAHQNSAKHLPAPDAEDCTVPKALRLPKVGVSISEGGRISPFSRASLENPHNTNGRNEWKRSFNWVKGLEIHSGIRFHQVSSGFIRFHQCSMLLWIANRSVFRNPGHRMEHVKSQGVQQKLEQITGSDWIVGQQKFEPQPVQSQVVSTLGFSPWYSLSAHPT